MNSICSTGCRVHEMPRCTCQKPAAFDPIEPLLVRPKTAWKMLGCGNTRGYELLAIGELASFRDGRSRKIVVSSIRDYIARQIAADSKKNVKRTLLAPLLRESGNIEKRPDR
jgi:hypothetical protein